MCALREEFPYSHQTGSLLFSQPAFVDQWSQSVPFGEPLPLTPPDTVSDCSTSDCQDMTHHGWSQASLPEESWTTAHGEPEYSTYAEPYGPEWQSHAHGQAYATPTQDVSFVNEATPWSSAPSGTVDLGLSPVLSYDSQSSHTLNSRSEPDMSVLPASLDLSFVAEPVWHGTDSVVYQHQQPLSIHGSTSGGNVPPASSRRGYGPVTRISHTPAAPLSYPAAGEIHRPVYASQAPQMAYPGQGLPYTVVQPRPLLPRTDDLAMTSQPVYGPQRLLRPQMALAHGSPISLSSVSSTRGHPARTPWHPPPRSHGPPPLAMPATQSMPSGFAGIGPPMMSMAGPDLTIQARSTGFAGQWMDNSEEWTSLESFEHDERSTSSRTLSFTNGYMSHPAQAPALIVPSSTVKPLAAEPNQVAALPIPAMSLPNTSGATSIESDEGRHRNHPLYSEGPKADGLYHCPYKGDPSCQHRPTKLKCNYDKFVDSHLKPFRCKVDSCIKQEFSSTACLLRHEREAHGMHGHGDRPHLCYYPGCERGMTGNGFPRRYNLFDHMKRVHDHQEELDNITGSPAMGDALPRRTAGRKRKASGPPLGGEPMLQRQRTDNPAQVIQPMHVNVRTAQSMAMVPPEYPQASQGPFVAPEHHQVVPQPQPQRRESHYRQCQLYSQWASQREVIARQIDFVQSPDDEANLQQLSQNIEELRRLSQEARRG
ncbi:hypothetical protein LTR53_003890 [Teratosphaeriaceae sp. CCFEE 6253]|nr:hypothetical protein LTR53_003890 [Teratosphaeriaceae sp. CCFEE 6253]